MKKLTSLILALIMCVGMLVSVATPISASKFTDVADGQWYTEAVNWAVNRGVTTGTSETTFSPDMTCDRAQAVTFIWRALGSPEPSTTVHPFSDVKSSDYFYKPVIWALENGVTTGTTATTFAPTMKCSRSQIVTFLWRAMGAVEVSATNPFSDVATGDWFANAVLWAVAKNVTTGTSATTFSPDMACSRGQIVTFLMRAVTTYEEENRPEYASTGIYDAEGNSIYNLYLDIDKEHSFKVKIYTNSPAPYTVTISGNATNGGVLDTVTTNEKEFTWKHTFTDAEYGEDGMIDLRTEVVTGSGFKGGFVDNYQAKIFKNVPLFLEYDIPKTNAANGFYRDAVDDAYFVLDPAVVAHGGTNVFTYKWQYKFPGGADFTDFTGSEAFIKSNNFDPTSSYLQLGVAGKDMPDGIYLRCIVVDSNGAYLSSTEGFFYGDIFVGKQPTEKVIDRAQGVGATVAISAFGGVGELKYQWQYYENNSWYVVSSSAGNGQGTDTLKIGYYTDIELVRCHITDSMGHSYDTRTYTIESIADANKG